MGLSWRNNYLIYIKIDNEIRKNSLNYTFMQQNLSIIEGHKVKVNSSLVITLQWDEASPSMQMLAAQSTKSIIYIWKMMKYYIAWFLNLQFISLLLIVKKVWGNDGKKELGVGVIQDFKTYTLSKRLKSKRNYIYPK